MPELKGLRRAALQTANKVRKSLGRPPVEYLYKGKRRDGDNCPITNTIYDDDLDHNQYRIDTDYDEITVEDYAKANDDNTWPESSMIFHLSKGAREFVQRFDMGDMPDLES